MRRCGPAFGIGALFVTAVLVAVACGGNRQDAKVSAGFDSSDAGAPPPCTTGTPGTSGQPCSSPMQSCPPGQACAPAAAPLGSVHTTDPNALAQLLAAAAAAGSAWLGPAAAIADPAEAGLRAAASQHAPGMSPEGQVAKGNLAEGGHVGFVVNMEPTKCYAVVAYGAGVTDLDVHLLAPPFYNFVAGQDGMAGPTAVVGAAPKPLCPLIPMAVPYKIDLHAKKGAGQVAAQVYSKAK